MRVLLLLLLTGAMAGCGAAESSPPEVELKYAESAGTEPAGGDCETQAQIPDDPFVACVDTFSPAPEASFGHDSMPQIVMGPPRGAGELAGSTDVVSLGCGGSITLYFDDPVILDGPGPDLVIFENPFVRDEETFAEPARVLLSEDGEAWVAFDCLVDDGWPPTGCAGIGPVLATDEDTAIQPERSGGDAFDLADLGLPVARYLRLIDQTEAYYGDRIWCGGTAGGFDLDAVAVIEHD